MRKKVKPRSLFILPARWEGFGIVLIEAGILGLPVISTNVGGIPEIISDNINGFLVEPDSPNDICKKALELIASQSKCDEMGKEGKKNVRRNFSIEKMVLDTEIWHR